MNRIERRKRLAEAYSIISTELDQHLANGSEFLLLEVNGEDSPDDVVKLRVRVLKSASLAYARRAARLEKRR